MPAGAARAARCAGCTTTTDWAALGFDAVDGRPPLRPWHADELDRALDLAEAIAAATDPVPPGLRLRTVVEEVPPLVGAWDRGRRAAWPHRAEARALATAYASLPDRAFCHTDLRDDNVLLLDDGSAVACDWNWPALGAAWHGHRRPAGLGVRRRAGRRAGPGRAGR